MLFIFIHIDWTGYVKALVAVLVIYWLIIGLLFYRGEIGKFLSRRKRAIGHPMNIDNPFEGQDASLQTALFEEEEEKRVMQPENGDDTVFPLLYELANEIKDRI
ncbi:MAG TPA: hypothetical protein VHC48_19525, partial [Puia sp.]|nr:hypothetical protein [Puia sp.]